MRIILAVAALAITMLSCKDAQKTEDMKISYPEVRKDTIVEDYHGTKIADPYRWLEDDNSEETKAWVKAQNKVTYDYLDKIPYRGDIRDRLEKMWNFERFSSPFKEGDTYYYYKNDGLQNQSVIYATDDIKKEGKVFLDPNTLSKDGTASLGGMSFSKDGRYCAYFVSEGGSDWRTGYVLDTKTGKKLDDRIEWAKFSGISWRGDGFYYSRYPAPKEGDELSGSNEFHSVYYHKLGDDQSKDKLIYVDKEHPQRNAGSSVSEDERYVFITTSQSTSGNDLRYIDMVKNPSKQVKLVDGYDHDFWVVDNKDDILYVLTNYDAPNKRLIAIDTKAPQKSNWKDLIPESEDALRGISIVGNRIFAQYLHDASSLIKVYERDGKYVQDLKLPGIGSSSGVSGKRSDKMGFFSFSSFISPTSIYHLNTETLEYEVFRRPEVDFDTDAYETKQVWYTSKDGTKVPMFLTMKKGTKLDGSNPTLLYGYGGFNIPITPGFSITRLPLLEQGGIYAVANIRGGGEFGKKWHKAGTKGEKQNVFDDFIAAAEYLIAQKYTSSEKLAIEGRSNGGLLVGACMTQRPDLFAVAYPGVGVLDMLRYHKFTIGWAWAGDYGRSDEKEAFDYLVKYSPLHNVKPAAYPSSMVNTADHDDRVVPAHSFKFISELQDKHTGENPVLVRVETSAGHGAGKPTSMAIDEAADNLSFLFYSMGETYKK